MGPGSTGGGSVAKRAEPTAVRARLWGSVITRSEEAAISMAAKKFGSRQSPQQALCNDQISAE